MRYEQSEEQAIEESTKWKCWDKFLESRSNPGFRQSSWFASFIGWKNFGTVLKDGETIVGGAVVFRRTFGPDKCYYYVPDGPVLLETDPISDQKQAFDAILEFIEGQRQGEQRVVSHLCIEPRWERVPGFVTGFRESKHYYGFPRDTQCIDLDPSADDILAQVEPKGRYNVRVARRHGVSVLEDVSSQGIADFLNICEETFARKELSANDPDFFHALIPMLSASGRGSVFFAEYRGTRLATALVGYFADTATYYFGGSRAIHRDVMAPYLLHFEIMRKAKALGCRYYDLFGVTPSGAPDDDWKDISVFKRKLGGRELRLVPSLEYVYDPVAYEEWEAQEQPDLVPVNAAVVLVRTGLSLSAGVLGSCLQAQDITSQASSTLDNWDKVRDQFELSKEFVHMCIFFITSHPKPVRDAIEAHRRQLDQNPVGYIFDNGDRLEGAVLIAAANYLGVDPADIALTDSTTMGLALLYNGLTLRQGQEILTTVHDHYSTAVSLQLRAARAGASVRTISLYSNPATATKDEIVQSFVKALRPQTRIVAVTWVHSSTGVKLPIREMADALAQINASRAEEDQALLCVDGVHGLGVEDIQLKDLGCDFFIAGCHKWLFGPRGTGLVWGTPRAWAIANPIIPTFSVDAFLMWMKVSPIKDLPPGAVMTPGGFHSFEHRWALDQAFLFHQRIGKARICERIHHLNQQLKEGLAKMGHVKLHTPLSDDLSAGIVCFEVDGLTPYQVVDRLRERRIIASLTPYTTCYVRLAPSLVTSPEEVDRTLQEVREAVHTPKADVH